MRHVFWVLFIMVTFPCVAQKYVAEKSLITFFSDAAVEDITAANEKASSVFNTQSMEIAFSVPIKEFQFPKKLMQEHFNGEKYMESEKFPKSTFSGTVSGFSLNAKGVQQAKATGKLTIHGVTTPIEILGTAEVMGDKINLKAKFIVKLADYKIKIPQILWQNIAEQVEVTIDFTYKPQ